MKKLIAIVSALVLVAIFNSCSFDEDKVSNDYTTVNIEKSDSEVSGMSLLNFLKKIFQMIIQ